MPGDDLPGYCSIMRIIVTKVKNCSECPHVDHSGAFTPGGAYPLCDKSAAPPEQAGKHSYKGGRRIIPFSTKNNERMIKKGIPKWCPLQEYDDFPEFEPEQQFGMSLRRLLSEFEQTKKYAVDLKERPNWLVLLEKIERSVKELIRLEKV